MKYIFSILAPTDEASEQKHEQYVANAARDLGEAASFVTIDTAISRSYLLCVVEKR